MLGPHVDEIELLLFESRPAGAMPERREIDTLARISRDASIQYNIHLPIDISLASSDETHQTEAVDTLRHVLELTSGLDATSYTLHIPYDTPGKSETDIKRWQARAHRGLTRLLGTGISPRQVAVENIDYPFEWIGEVVRALNLSVCMDTGHLLLGRENPGSFYREYAERIAIIHLHAARDGRDHLPLTQLSQTESAAVEKILTDFSGTLSLEVFSYDYLVDCMGGLIAHS
jgi:sugar phosphate isomerase/epimerase